MPNGHLECFILGTSLFQKILDENIIGLTASEDPLHHGPLGDLLGLCFLRRGAMRTILFLFNFNLPIASNSFSFSFKRKRSLVRSDPRKRRFLYLSRTCRLCCSDHDLYSQISQFSDIT